MTPLAPILTERLEPGSNRKGELPGANWRFLLPRLSFRRVVCLGTPSAATLTTLRSMSPDVVVMDRDAARLTLPDDAADLLVVLGARMLARLLRDPGRWAEVERVLDPGAPILVEGHGLSRHGGLGRLLDRFGGRSMMRFVATPHVGELETAVPRRDAVVLDWFERRGLLRASIDTHDLGRVWRRLAGRGPRRSGAGSSGGALSAPTGRARSLRGAVAGGLALLARAERTLDASVPAARREVALLRRDGDERVAPPDYLVCLARTRDLDLTDHRWGLAAGAEYASQKVLIPLFPPGETRPRYLVKLVREGRHSPRLDRAADALERLEAMGLADGCATPRIVFRGHEAGLAVAAETAIDGESFRVAVTDGAADGHRTAQAVVEWLTRLGERSRTTHPVTDGGPAGTLTALLDRFVELYRPRPAQAAFLQDRIAAGSDAVASLPLVMQHGDPGPQNLIVARSSGIGVLDWENADPLGLPLADIIYFLWTYGVLEGVRRGIRDPFAAGIPHVLGTTSLTSLIAGSIDGYRTRMGLDQRLLEPLFYGSWMYQAVKEASRLPPDRLGHGVYARLLQACAARPDAPGLRAFLAPGSI